MATSKHPYTNSPRLTLETAAPASSTLPQKLLPGTQPNPSGALARSFARSRSHRSSPTARTCTRTCASRSLVEGGEVGPRWKVRARGEDEVRAKRGGAAFGVSARARIVGEVASVGERRDDLGGRYAPAGTLMDDSPDSEMAEGVALSTECARRGSGVGSKSADRRGKSSASVGRGGSADSNERRTGVANAGKSTECARRRGEIVAGGEESVLARRRSCSGDLSTDGVRRRGLVVELGGVVCSSAAVDDVRRRAVVGIGPSTNDMGRRTSAGFARAVEVDFKRRTSPSTSGAIGSPSARTPRSHWGVSAAALVASRFADVSRWPWLWLWDVLTTSYVCAGAGAGGGLPRREDLRGSEGRVVDDVSELIEAGRAVASGGDGDGGGGGEGEDREGEGG